MWSGASPLHGTKEDGYYTVAAGSGSHTPEVRYS